MNAQKHPSLIPEWSLWPSRVVFVLTLIWVSQQMLTDNPVAMSALFWDKFLHAGAWGFMVGLGYIAYQRSSGWFWFVLSILTYSIALEVLQPIVANRFFSFGDILANSLGCLIAGVCCKPTDSWLSRTLQKT